MLFHVYKVLIKTWRSSENMEIIQLSSTKELDIRLNIYKCLGTWCGYSEFSPTEDSEMLHRYWMPALN